VPPASARALHRVPFAPGDAEVIAACDRLGIAMMFTDRRVFAH